MSSDSSDDSGPWAGVYGTTRPAKRRRADPGSSRAWCYAGSGAQHPPRPSGVVGDAAGAEAALMAAMGLPTGLRPHTAEINGDRYRVIASDPAALLPDVLHLAVARTQEDDEVQSILQQGCRDDDGSDDDLARALSAGLAADAERGSSRPAEPLGASAERAPCDPPPPGVCIRCLVGKREATLECGHRVVCAVCAAQVHGQSGQRFRLLAASSICTICLGSEQPA